MTGQTDIGLIGLAVMGQNLVLNMDDHGFPSRSSTERSRRSTSSSPAPPQGTNVVGTHSLEELVGTLKRRDASC